MSRFLCKTHEKLFHFQECFKTKSTYTVPINNETLKQLCNGTTCFKILWDSNHCWRVETGATITLFRLSTTKQRISGCYLTDGEELATVDSIKGHRTMILTLLQPSSKRSSRAKLAMNGSIRTSKLNCAWERGSPVIVVCAVTYN